MSHKASELRKNRKRYRYPRYYVDFCTRYSYSRLEVTGKENIPRDSAVILAPNHCNALMDALSVLRTGRGPMVFGARADIFENPLIARFLHFLKILPMVRQRDGIRNVIKNLDIFEDIQEVIAGGVPFCMFPEGTHRTRHSLLPIGKGVFRIAMSAASKLDKPVYVVPVGLEYGDYFRFESSSLVSFGEPIDVAAFISAHPGLGEADVYKAFTTELRERLSSLITYIPDNEDYDAVWAYAKAATVNVGGAATLVQRLKANQAAVRSVTVFDGEDAVGKKIEADARLILAREFEEKRRRARVSIKSFSERRRSGFWPRTLGLLLWLPIQLLLMTMGALPLAVIAILLGKFVKDRAFDNSIRCACNLFLSPFVMAAWVLLLILGGGMNIVFSIIYSLFFGALTVPAFYQGLEWYRLWLSDLRLRRHPELLELFHSFTAAD